MMLAGIAFTHTFIAWRARRAVHGEPCPYKNREHEHGYIKLVGGFDDQLDCFFQIAASFGETPALRIYTRNFFHGRNIPFTALFDDCSELAFHRFVQ
jgi:hypothetical protein